ncbi:Cwf15/Cwc15 cell cycle control protein [Cooperia oncophora]
MTTAHRPTFHPARGGTGRTEGDLSKLSQQYSSKDMPSHTKLKYRQQGQGTEEELRRRDLRRELEDKEKVASRERRNREAAASSSSNKRARIEESSHAAVDADEPLDEVGVFLTFLNFHMPSHTKLKYRQQGQGTEEELRRRDLRRELEDKEKVASRERRNREAAASSSSNKRARIEESSHAAVDADEPLDEHDSSDDDSDEDDTAALMAELERIKKERAEEKAAKEEEEKRREEKIRMDNILAGNPLLNPVDSASSSNGGDFKVKRRWDDDVVFKNCAKGRRDCILL